MADRVGLHSVKTPNAEYRFSCNAVSRDESDLGGCRSGQWGSWNVSEVHRDRRVSLAWVFLLVALAAMAAHAAVVGGKLGGANA